MRKHTRGIAIIVAATMLLVSFSNIQGVSTLPEFDALQTGPYVDEIIYKIIPDQDSRILALQAGSIEMDTNFMNTSHLPTLASEPDIDYFTTLRNGYGQITINCRDYPLNISGLRRAFAYTFDKTQVTVDIWDGFSIEHDSLVPQSNNWCVEDELQWNYYSDQSATGNQILDDLGFEINGTTGFRDAPNGEPFMITIEYDVLTPEFDDDIAQIGVDALHSLHINAESSPEDRNEYVSHLISHGEYDMAVYSTNFHDFDIKWLAYEFWSEYANVEGENPCNFANETYDNWRDQLLYGNTYEEVYEAAAEMQKILHYNVPKLVVYENTLLQAYRNDRFGGYVEDIERYMTGQWTMRNIYKLDHTLGGSVSVAISDDITSFNFFLVNKSSTGFDAIACLWPSLYKQGPELTSVSDLAISMLRETHSDNSNVQIGHLRFTFDIIQNATWSDGVPLTADDIAFTFTYQFESGYFGNPAVNELMELFSAYAPTHDKVVIEFSTESYWHFKNIAYDYILPQHIFNNSGGVGYAGWDTWNPVFDSLEPNVNCGPFTNGAYVEGDHFIIENNHNFYYRLRINDSTSTTTTSTTTPYELDWITVLTVSIVSVGGIVIVYFILKTIRRHRSI